MSGGVIAVPTDTVYGLACDPADADAVERIYSIKARPADVELTLLGANAAAFTAMVDMSPVAQELADRYWPGPLSVIAPLIPPEPHQRRLAIPRRGRTLSVRVPVHPDLLALLAATGPLATTSANRHGSPPGNSAPDVRQALGAEIDGILDGGPGGGQASTIIDCSTQPPRVVREGPISAAELRPYLT